MNPSDIRLELERFRRAGINGDAMAAVRLKSRFGDGLNRFVRRVLRNGGGSGSLAKFILNEAAQIRDHHPAQDRDKLVSEIINRICAVATGQGIAGRVETVPVGDRPTLFPS